MPETHTLRPVRPSISAVEPTRVVQRHAYAAFRVLQVGFVAMPILVGLDKFLHWMTNWDMYLASPIEKILPFRAHTFMMIAGVIEIAAGILVAWRPRIGGFVVSAWLLGITVNLLIPPGFYDIALRDFGLALGAFSLGLLALEFSDRKAA